MSQPFTRPRPASIRPGWGLLVVVVAVALNLRPAITAVPPVLDTIQADLGLSAAGAGLLTALPVLCMGVFAPVGAALARRVGREVAVSCGLVLVVGGTMVRASTTRWWSCTAGPCSPGSGSPSAGRCSPGW